MAWSPAFAVGQWAIAGQVAVLLQLIMAAFATKHFRERHYWLFRGTHALYPLVFMASIAHAFECFFCYQLGMILIMADVAARLSVAVHSTTAVLTPISSTNTACEENTVIVQAKSQFAVGSVQHTALPGRFFYLQVPDVSAVEWHPMSVTHADAEGNLTFTIKVFGM
jgi:predicted ferric reductase